MIITNIHIYYALVYILLLLSGSPALNRYPLLTGIAGGISLLYSIVHKSDFKKRSDLWMFFVFMLVIFILQISVLGKISYLGSFNVLAKVIFGATVMWILKSDFKYIYFRAMYHFSILSLFFFAVTFFTGWIVPDIFPVESNIEHSILIYTALTDTVRNCGPFWEPGAYACYLLLIPVLYIDKLDFLFKTYKKECFVLLFALITTFSTTGYICFFIILFSYIITLENKILIYLFVLPAFLLLSFTIYKGSDFMSKKIEYQLDKAEGQKGKFSNTRVGALLFDLHYFKKHPFVGNGLLVQTRYSDHPYLWKRYLGHGNGFSNFILQFGFLVAFYYFILIYKNIASSKRNKKWVLLIIILILQGEPLLNYPLFLGLPFIRNKIESI